jgi:hypothetical protein
MTHDDMNPLDNEVFTVPTAPAGPWGHLTENEKAWIEFIRVISCGSDPKVTPARVRALRALLDAGPGGAGRGGD